MPTLYPATETANNVNPITANQFLVSFNKNLPIFGSKFFDASCELLGTNCVLRKQNA